MDVILRRLYREYGGHDLRFLINCNRAGSIPLDAHIELSLLPEIARYTILDRVRVSYLSPIETNYVMQHYMGNREQNMPPSHRVVSRLGELVADYALASDSWTLFGNSRQIVLNKFLVSSSLSRDSLEEIFYEDPDDDLEIGDMVNAIVSGYDGSILDLELNLDGHILDLYETRLNTEIIRLIWGVRGSMLEAVIRITAQIGTDLVSFFITLIGDATMNYERVVSISANVEDPIWTDYMLLWQL